MPKIARRIFLGLSIAAFAYIVGDTVLGGPVRTLLKSSTPASSAILTSSSKLVNIQVDTRVTYQRWIAWSTVSRRWDAPHMFYGPEQGHPIDSVPQNVKEKILDLLYTELKLNSVEVALEGGPMDPSFHSARPESGWTSHEPENDNSDPFTTDSDRLNFSYWPPLLDIVKKAFARIRQHGDEPVFFLRVGGTEAWMRNGAHGPNLALNPIDSTLIEEYVEWVVSLIQYFQRDHDLIVDYVSVMNEPEGGDGRVAASVLAQLADQLDQRLRNLSLRTRVIAPETVTRRNAIDLGYLRELESRGVAPRLGLINYHIYDHDASVGSKPDYHARELLRDFADKHGIPTFMTELSSDVKSNRHTFWNNTAEQALAWANDFVDELTVTNASGITMMWNFWTNTNPNFGSDALVNLIFDEHNNSAFIKYELPLFYSILGEFINNIRPGMVRVEAASDDPDVRVIAFKDERQSKLVVVVVNNAEVNKPVLFPNGMGGDVPAKAVKAFENPLL